MKDYTQIETSSLTPEDALNDDEFKLKPQDVFEYVAIDKIILKSFADFMTVDEVGETMIWISKYCIDKLEPQYDVMNSPVVKMAVGQAVESHKRRIMGEYLKRYKQFVGAKAQRQRPKDT